MECKIRLAREGDAEEVSHVILWALRETNAKDYIRDFIERVELNFSPSVVRDLMGIRRVFIAEVGHRIVGTASLDRTVVRTVFVAPDSQGLGVGRLLMGEVERAAREMGVKVLEVPSTITAEPFYAKLGFKAVRDSYYGEERTIIMERPLVLF
jgi:N-acetylglutamate synthase-like GNAT family acetyltransferase